MEKESCRSFFSIFLFIIVAAAIGIFSYSAMSLSAIQGLTVNTGDPISPDIFRNNSILNKMSCEIYRGDCRAGAGSGYIAPKPGKYYLQFKMMGLPLTRLAVNAVSQVKVIPGGQSIGIEMHSKGIMVVGMSNITDGSGNTVNPAEKAGIRIGDLIVSVNGKKIEREIQLRNEIARCGLENKAVDLEINRSGKTFKTSMNPVTCRETGRPRVGLFVRDTASGVGTLSFYDPESGTYGALGHIITDIDTARGIDLSEGRIIEASVRGIRRGKRGSPGEKIGMFIEGGSISGNILRNTRYGIFGKLGRPPESPIYSTPVPVALSYQIKKGPAELLTVIDGTEIKKYSVEIQEIMYPWNNQGKGLIIKITDPVLIEATGGIIQGMSGSPIIQDGMLAGVLTHVFINDPQRGYGVPAEWMLKEAGLINSDTKLQKVS